MYALGEGLEATEGFLEHFALGLCLGQGGDFFIEFREALPCLPQARLEFVLAHESVLVGIQQSRDALLYALAQGARRLRRALVRCFRVR